jgi:hypothetical protein
MPCGEDGHCPAGRYCAADGRCAPAKPERQTCNTAAGQDCLIAGCRACASGHCVDGFCCDTACDGDCQACAAAFKASGTGDGVCGHAATDTDPHEDCMPDPGACLRDGLCDGSGACRRFTPAATTCTVADADGGAIEGTCSGGGACVTGGAVCKDDHTVTGAGAEQDCTPYRCAAGTCRVACTRTSDCVAGYVCHPSQNSCVAPGAGGTGAGGGGCGCGLATTTGGLGAGAGVVVLLEALGALAATRRRRRRRRAPAGAGVEIEGAIRASAAR